MNEDVLGRFSPATRGWFRSNFAAPTPAQVGAWDAISSGRHTLVVAPTGSGKTLSAFLWALDRLATVPADEGRLRRCRVLYISPLKALAVDVERNLRSPLVGIGQAAARLGLAVPQVQVAVRSGDTPSEERRAFARQPSDILITTPESLFLLLTSAAREALAGVETVIIDEIHAVAGTKRGAHLAISLERLDGLLPRPAQRIGLSATVRPVEEVARFLAGGRDVAVVAPPSEKKWQLEVVVPVPDLAAIGETTGDLSGTAAGDPQRTSIWPHVEERIVDLIAAHRSTIVFTNSRRLAERLTARLNEIWVERLELLERLGESSASDRVATRAPAGVAATGPDEHLSGEPPEANSHGRTSRDVSQTTDNPTTDTPAGRGARQTTGSPPGTAAQAQTGTNREHPAGDPGTTTDERTGPRRHTDSPSAHAPIGREPAHTTGSPPGTAAQAQTGTNQQHPAGDPVPTVHVAPAFARGFGEQAAGVTLGRSAIPATRAPAQVMAQSAISRGAPAVLARAHHGSVSREQRQQTEEDLKAGRLPAVVATSSLELGIDMGAVDLVIQVEAPPSVASGLQRVGRAGHQVGAVSRGVLFPKFRGDLVQTAVITERMRAGAIEALRVPATPLDVLAQQVVAMVALDEWTVEALLTLVRRAAPFSGLTRPMLDSVLDMLSGRYPSDEFAELRPRLTWDRLTDTLTGRRGAQRLAVTSGGTIPDRGLYGVFLAGADGPGRRVGELDEEMVYESRVGDVFTLGTSTWRIEQITHDRVLVTPAPGQAARLPFWKGDSPGRPAELGRAVGAFVRELSGSSAVRSRERVVAAGLDEWAADNLLRYLDEQREAIGRLPHDRQIVVERFRDELGDWRVVVHSPFGAQVHAPWALAVAARLRERYGVDVQAMHADDGLVFRLPDTGWDGGMDGGIPEPELPATNDAAYPRVAEEHGSGEASPPVAGGTGSGVVSPRVAEGVGTGVVSPRVAEGVGTGAASPRVAEGVGTGVVSPPVPDGTGSGAASPPVAGGTGSGAASPQVAEGVGTDGATPPAGAAATRPADSPPHSARAALPTVTATHGTSATRAAHVRAGHLDDLLEAIFLDPDEVSSLVTEQIGGSALFASRFRECAGRALLLPKRRPDRRQALWQQRQRAAQLLEVAAGYPSFPIVLEAVRECVNDVFDVPALVELLRGVRSREIATLAVETPRPSPFASSLMFGYVAQFLYEGDSPLAEKRAAALALDPSLLAELLGTTEGLALSDLLDPEALTRTENELQHLAEPRRARDPDDLTDVLRAIGPLDHAQLARRVTEPDSVGTWLVDLESSRRVIRVRIAEHERWAAVEDAGRLRDALGVSLPLGVAAAFLTSTPDPLGDLLARYGRSHAPFTASEAAAWLGLGPAVVRDGLRRLVADGRLVEGDLRPPGWVSPDSGGSPGRAGTEGGGASATPGMGLAGSPYEASGAEATRSTSGRPGEAGGRTADHAGGIPDRTRSPSDRPPEAGRRSVEHVGGLPDSARSPSHGPPDVLRGTGTPSPAGAQFCDARVLRLLRRRSLATLRSAVEPVSAGDFARFLPSWQGLGQLRGVEGVYRVAEQLAGLAVPASALETLILPARVLDYQPAMLDELTTAGDVLWQGQGSLGGHDGWVSLHPADLAPLTLAPMPESPLSELGGHVRELLGRHGGFFFRTLSDALELTDDTALTAALWDAVWAGTVTNDTLAPLRALLRTGTTTHRARPGPATPLRHGRGLSRAALPRRTGPPQAAGRWSALPEPEPDQTERAVALAELLLDRYGVVTRGSVAAENVPGGFAAVYRVLAGAEEAGRVRRGYFVERLGAAQFASTGAIDRLRGSVRPLDAPSSSEALVLAATDPAQPYGAALPWPDRAVEPGRGQSPNGPAGPGRHTTPYRAREPGRGQPPDRGEQGLGQTPDRGEQGRGQTPERAAGPGLRTSLAGPAEPGRGHQPARKAGALVVLVDGDVVLYVERGGRTLLSFTDDPASLGPAATALAAAVHRGALGRLTVQKVDGEAVLGSNHPLAHALEQAGFRLTPRGLRLRS